MNIPESIIRSFEPHGIPKLEFRVDLEVMKNTLNRLINNLDGMSREDIKQAVEYAAITFGASTAQCVSYTQWHEMHSDRYVLRFILRGSEKHEILWLD
jgi:hypothetical protein